MPDPSASLGLAPILARMPEAPTLVPLALHVDHIRSTAIPDMAAKPVFDVQIRVEDLQGGSGPHGRQRPSKTRFAVAGIRR